MKTDDELRALWRNAGGEFHGPNVETGTMPEAKLLPFLGSLINQQGSDAETITGLCDRLERINKTCHNISLSAEDKVKQAEEWSAGFAPIPPCSICKKRHAEPECPQPVTDDCKLTELHMTEREGIQAQFEGAAVKAFSTACVDWFRESGGSNYVTCSLRDPKSGEEYVLTMQKAIGKTPAQELNELRMKLLRARSAMECNDPLNAREIFGDPTPQQACQHDLLAPNPTVEVIGSLDSKCSVCNQEWHLPGSEPLKEGESAMFADGTFKISVSSPLKKDNLPDRIGSKDDLARVVSAFTRDYDITESNVAHHQVRVPASVIEPLKNAIEPRRTLGHRIDIEPLVGCSHARAAEGAVLVTGVVFDTRKCPDCGNPVSVRRGMLP